MPCPRCPSGWGLSFPHGWVSPGRAMLPARPWSLWGTMYICIPHTLSCIPTSPPWGSGRVPSRGAQMCLSVFEDGRAQQRVPTGRGRARLPHRHPWPRDRRCLVPAPRPPPCPGSPRSAGASARQDERSLPRAGACQVESPGSQESQRCAAALPGPPAGNTRGARRGSGGCWDAPWLMCRVGHRHVDVSPLARGARGVLCAWAGGVRGSGAGAVGASGTCPSPRDTQTVPGLRSLPRALLPWESRGGARSPPLLPRAQHGESQVQHVTNLICSTR